MRARNMQSLTDDIKRRHPGVVIYGIGNDEHKLHTSDHNEDDTPGSMAAQSDADSNPEHRAIDVMLGPAFSKEDADKLVNALVSDPDSRARLYNIIWYRGIWSRSWGWTRRDYTGDDPHTNHPHIAGWAADDENAAGWPAVDSASGGVNELFCKYGDQGSNVTYLQYRLKNLNSTISNLVGDADGGYGNQTAAGLAAAIRQHNGSTVDGKTYGPAEMIYIDALWAKKFADTPGPAGPAGPAGPRGPAGAQGVAGPAGPAGQLVLPATFTFTGTVDQVR